MIKLIFPTRIQPAYIIFGVILVLTLKPALSNESGLFYVTTPCPLLKKEWETIGILFLLWEGAFAPSHNRLSRCYSCIE